jgi:tripartite-type tricarboxylate transporter receptor subunit TctC
MEMSMPNWLATRYLLKLAALALACILQPSLGWAQSGFPSRTISIVIPYAPGGSAEPIVRQAAKLMGSALNQSVIVENKAGANGMIGATYVAKSKPDGYTLLNSTDPVLVLNPLLYKGLSYTEKDFKPVALLASIPAILVVNADLPVKTVDQLVAYAKAHPGEVDFGSSGAGGVFHLTTEYFAAQAGIKVNHIPFSGGGPAIQNLMGGYVQAMFTFPSKLLAESPRVRILAVAAPKRIPSLPDVPTFAEAGMNAMVVQTGLGLVAPRDTPAPVIARLESAANAALADAEYRSTFEPLGYVLPQKTSSAEFGASIARERQRWAKVIADRHITMPSLKP